jgi:hypothetical protein
MIERLNPWRTICPNLGFFLPISAAVQIDLLEDLRWRAITPPPSPLPASVAALA